MQSKIYSSLIKFQQNVQEMFVSDCFDCDHKGLLTKPLNSQNPLVLKYFKAVSKLFKQIDLNHQNLWIFPINGTTTIRIYFSNPQFYPVSLCCEKCVYLQIQDDLSGSIICPSCKIVLVSFLHYDQNSINKEGKISQNEKQRLFKEKKRQNMTKNKLMYENLTSHRYKTKDLKRFLSNSGSNLLSSQNSSMANSQLSQNDGFILEMKAQIIKYNQNKEDKVQRLSIRKLHQKINQPQSKSAQLSKPTINQKSIQETKNIIMEIFK